MIVLDASAAVELVLATARGAEVAAVVAGEELLAPELLDVEVCSALARLERAGQVPASVADTAVDALASLPVVRVTHQLLHRAAWRRRARLRVADAFYVACAELAKVPVLTCDVRLARAGLDVPVTVVA